jgi:hypothetical protein
MLYTINTSSNREESYEAVFFYSVEHFCPYYLNLAPFNLVFCLVKKEIFNIR